MNTVYVMTYKIISVVMIDIYTGLLTTAIIYLISMTNIM